MEKEIRFFHIKNNSRGPEIWLASLRSGPCFRKTLGTRLKKKVSYPILLFQISLVDINQVAGLKIPNEEMRELHPIIILLSLNVVKSTFFVVFELLSSPKHIVPKRICHTPVLVLVSSHVVVVVPREPCPAP